MSKTSTTLDKNVSNMVKVTSNQKLTKLHNQPLNVQIDDNRTLLTQINKSSKLNSASHLPFKKRYLQDFSGKVNLSNHLINDLKKEKIGKASFMGNSNENCENLSNHKNLEENILPKNKKIKQGEQIKLYQAQVSPCSDSANGTSVGDRSDNSIQSSPTMKRGLADTINESNRTVDCSLNRLTHQNTVMKTSVGSKGSKSMMMQEKFQNAKVILQLSENGKNSKMSGIPIDMKNRNLRIIQNTPHSTSTPTKQYIQNAINPKKQYIHLSNGQIIPKESYLQNNQLRVPKSTNTRIHNMNIPMLNSNNLTTTRPQQYIISKNKSCNNLIVTPSSSNIILSNNNGAKILNNNRQFVINSSIQNLAFTNGNRLPLLVGKNAIKVDATTVENLLASSLNDNINVNKFVNNQNSNFNIINGKNLLYGNGVENFISSKTNNIDKVRTQIDRPSHVQSPEQNKQKALDLHHQILKARQDLHQQRIKKQNERPVFNNLTSPNNHDDQAKLMIKQQKQQAYLNQQQQQQLKFYEKRNVNENILNLTNVELNIPLKSVLKVVNPVEKVTKDESIEKSPPIVIPPKISPPINKISPPEKLKPQIKLIPPKISIKSEPVQIVPKIENKKPESTLIDPPPICLQLPDLLMKQKTKEIEKEEAIKEINLKILKDKVAIKNKEPDVAPVTHVVNNIINTDASSCLKTSLIDSENEDKNLEQNFESDSQNENEHDNIDNQKFYKSICERTRNKGLPRENKNVIHLKKKSKYYENSSGLPDDESDVSPMKKVKTGRKLICGGEIIKAANVVKIKVNVGGDDEYKPSFSQQKFMEHEYVDIGSCGEKEVEESIISPKPKERSNSCDNPKEIVKRQRHRKIIKRTKSPSEKVDKIKKRRRHPSSVEANRITGIQETLDVDYGTAYNIDSNDESWNSITCFCRKPFAGRIMVECDACKIWYHIDCFKIKPNEIPNVFSCGVKKKCKILKAKLQQKQKKKIERKLSVTRKKEEKKKRNDESSDSLSES